MPTLYLIDGYAQFFRAYHAIRTPMKSPVTGEPTNMSFGFTDMLLKLLKANEPRMKEAGRADFVAVALDVSGDRGTFRSQLYPDYKATRDEPPEDLFPQVERCLAMLGAIGVPCIGAEGFEADDVIATIVRALEAQRPDLLIRIISKDKDLKQLLASGRVEMYDIHKDLVIDEASLMNDSGITPAQVVDMLTLMGDTADNVPGVAGIGPKTAAQLIAQLGTLDAVTAEVTNDKPKKDWIIKGKRRENIAASLDALPLSKTLVTLRDDAPVEFDLDAARTERLKLGELPPILKELGFNRLHDWAKELAGEAATEPNAAAQKQSTTSTLPLEGGLFDHIDDGSPEREIDGDYELVTTQARLEAWINKLESADAISIDTETTSLNPREAKLCGLCLAVEPGSACYIPVRSPDPSGHLDEPTVLAAVRPFLEDPSKAKIAHNLKYDLLVLRSAGVHLAGLDHADSCDTMVASYLIDSSRSSHALDALSLALLSRSNIPITELIGPSKNKGKHQKTFDQVPLDRAGPYAAEDADVTLQLAHLMMPQLRAMGLGELMQRVEMPLVGVLAELEWNGIRVDRAELDHQRERLETEIESLRQKIQDASMVAIGRSFDPDSPKQLAAALFNKDKDEPNGLGLKPLKKGKTGPSTDAEVLDKLDANPDIDTPIPGLVLEYRQLTKLVNTYLASLVNDIHEDDHRIHASFNQTVAATGRLSSSDPNLQNIPIRTDIGREIRRAFVAPEGRALVSADYSQIELRILAHLSQDEALIEAFRAGEDIHAAVAAQIHNVALEDVSREQRSGAKMVNFGIVYGITPFGLARRLGLSNAEAAEIITGYKARFPGITTFLDACVEQARQNGYVETMLKRRRPIHEIDARNPQRRALAERMAINSVVQGSAADLIKLAMIDLQQRIDAGELGKTLMLLQIHDELVFEADEPDAERVRGVVADRMESAMSLDVPLSVDSSIASNWYEGK